MEDFKEKVTAVGEEVTESVKQGAVNFIDDAATLKHSVDEVADDRQAAKEAKNAERKAQFDSAVADIKESFEQGVEAFKSDMNITKTSVDEVAADQKAAKAARRAARKEKFDNAIKELKASIAMGGEEFRSDGAVLLDSLKGIAEDAGIEIKENDAVSEAYNAVKESIEQGFENFKSDMNITKGSVEEVAAEQKAAIEAKDAADKKKFDETVASIKESVEQGVENFKNDMNVTKENFDGAVADQKAAKAAKKAANREKFDETVEELKKSLE